MRTDMQPETPSDLERLLRESLQGKASPVYARTPLAERAVRRARVVRLRRRVATVVACVAVLAVAIPLGSGVLGDNAPVKTRIRPADTPSVPPSGTPSPAAEERADVTITVDDLDALPQGEQPWASWYEDGVLHQPSLGGEQPDLHIPVSDLDDGAVVSYVPVAGGRLVADTCCGEDPSETRVRLIDDQGETIRTLPTTIMPAVSEGGDRLAWVEDEGGDGRDVDLVLADETGAELARHPLPKPGPASNPAHPVGFLGERVVVGRAATLGDTGGPSAAELWDPQAGTLAHLPAWGSDGGDHTVHVTDRTRLFVSTRHRSEGSALVSCQGMFDAEQRDEPLWSACDGLRVHELSLDEGLLDQNARLAYATRPSGSGLAALVVNAETGRRVLEIRGLDRARPVVVAEDTSNVLIDATVDGRSAILRCSLDGRCERATEVYDEGPDTGTAVTLPGRP